MGLLKKLFMSVSFDQLKPDQEIILGGPTEGGAKIRAATARDGSVLLVYSPRGEAFTIDKRRLMSGRMTEYWFDPRYGATYAIHTADTQGIQTYTPPTSGRGQDWMLIVEDAARGR